jgi:hypothetical protein
MDWLWFELVRGKKTRNGQGREANLLLLMSLYIKSNTLLLDLGKNKKARLASKHVKELRPSTLSDFSPLPCVGDA